MSKKKQDYEVADTHPRDLPVKLDDQQIRVKGIELAEMESKIEELDERHKAQKSQMKAEEDAANALRKRLAIIVASGFETRPIECETRRYYREARVDVVRRDTGEVVFTRQMVADEAQGTLVE